MVSWTGISSGVVDDVEGGDRRVGQEVAHPAGLRLDRPDRDELLDGLGGAELGHDVAGGGGVDDDEVPGGPALDGLPDLPADLPDGEDLLHPGRGGGHEVEHLGQRPDPPRDRHPQVQPQVLLERRLGVHGHGRQPGEDDLGPEPDRALLEEGGDVTPAVGRDEQHPLALLGGEQSHGGRDGALADPALSGEEQQPAAEQVRRRATAPAQPGPNPTRLVWSSSATSM